jgi:hypothetical protein
MVMYYTAHDEIEISNVYYRMLTSENYVDKINTVIDTIKAKSKKSAPIQKIQYIDHSSLYELQKNNYEYCCSNIMEMHSDMSKLTCEICGNVYKLVGSFYSEPQENTTKVKSSGYDVKHYKYWMERIQGTGEKSISQDKYDKIEAYIVRNRILKCNINCVTMRNILKDPSVKLSALYDNAPLLVKTFGGPAPPTLTYTESRLVSIKFNKLMELYNEIVPNGNNPYYPYFIYKILERLFPVGHEKRVILDYIHLQSRDTVIKNDNTYKEMCRLARPEDNLIYTPTDPHANL